MGVSNKVPHFGRSILVRVVSSEPSVADSTVVALEVLRRLQRLVLNVELEHLHCQCEKADPSNSFKLVLLTPAFTKELRNIVNAVVEFGCIADLTASFFVGALRIRDEESEFRLYFALEL